jgi:hypothetical protein
MLAFAVMLYSAIRTRRARPSQGSDERLGWAWLAGLLLIGGIVGPDSFGGSHGGILQPRVVLLGLVALVPIAEFDTRIWSGQLIAVALVIALGVQSAVVWDYALTSRRMAGALVAAREAVGTNQRVASLLVYHSSNRFRVDPLVHADNLLGIGTGNIIWSNYETDVYYFPVRFRPEIARPMPSDLTQFASTVGPANANLRASLWKHVIDDHLADIDTLVIWGSDPQLDAINRLHFDTVYRNDNVRVLRRVIRDH